MAEHGWTVLCTRMITDRETNQVTLVDAVDVFAIKNPEVLAQELREAKTEGSEGINLPADLVLVTWWFRSERDTPEMATARFRYENPAGQLTAGKERFPVDLSSGSATRTAIKLPALPFQGYGRHWCIIDRLGADGETWERMARLPLDVIEASH